VTDGRDPAPPPEPEPGPGPEADDSTEARAVADERARELAALRQVQGDLEAVDRALAHLDEGTYGTCEACGEPIADEVLAAAPTSRDCGAHAGAAPAGPAPAPTPS
jgi:DnaK suppressor protein